MNKIDWNDFKKVEIRVGTIIEAKENNLLQKPSLILKIDFGIKIGIKKTSAQITDKYNLTNLIGKQVVAICNLPSKNIAGIKSEVLILGAVNANGSVVLIQPDQKVENGLPVK